MALFKYNLENGRYVPYTNGVEPRWDNSNHIQEELRRRMEEADRAATFNFDDDLPFGDNEDEEDCPF